METTVSSNPGLNLFKIAKMTRQKHGFRRNDEIPNLTAASYVAKTHRDLEDKLNRLHLNRWLH